MGGITFAHHFLLPFIQPFLKIYRMNFPLIKFCDKDSDKDSDKDDDEISEDSDNIGEKYYIQKINNKFVECDAHSISPFCHIRMITDDYHDTRDTRDKHDNRDTTTDTSNNSNNNSSSENDSENDSDSSDSDSSESDNDKRHHNDTNFVLHSGCNILCDRNIIYDFTNVKLFVDRHVIIQRIMEQCKYIIVTCRYANCQ
jgi:hypothetical protein